jgi:hypothetical protein
LNQWRKISLRRKGPNTDSIIADTRTRPEQIIELKFRHSSSGHRIDVDQPVTAVSILKRVKSVDGFAFELRGRRGLRKNPDWNFLRSTF